VFGISMTEVVIILVVALIILGPRQLVDVAKLLGRLYREVQKLSWDIRNAVDFDSPPVSPPHYPPAPTPMEEDSPEDVGNDMIPASNGKSGPDFYAELLESSAEDDEDLGETDSEKVNSKPEETSPAEEKIENKSGDEPKEEFERTGIKEGAE
jgi:hypothetical protein